MEYFKKNINKNLVEKMDKKRTKELIRELENQIDEEEINKIEIKIKIMAILNELDIRPLELGHRDEI